MGRTMDFKTREDIEAPIDFVFGQVTDFVAFERSIMRRGGDVERISDSSEPALGMAWQVQFMLRGAERTAHAEIVELDAPHGYTIKVTSKNVDARMTLDLVALSRARTRLNIGIEAVAKTIPAKLVFQSMRFARNKPQSRLKGYVTNFAEDVEKRYRG